MDPGVVGAVAGRPDHHPDVLELWASGSVSTRPPSTGTSATRTSWSTPWPTASWAAVPSSRPPATVTAARTYQALLFSTLGHAMIEAPHAALDPAQAAAELTASRLIYQTLPAGAYPDTAAVAPHSVRLAGGAVRPRPGPPPRRSRHHPRPTRHPDGPWSPPVGGPQPSGTRGDARASLTRTVTLWFRHDPRHRGARIYGPGAHSRMAW
jgi:hypothetical protein